MTTDEDRVLRGYHSNNY